MPSAWMEAPPESSNRSCCVLRQTRTLFTAAWMKPKCRDHRFISRKRAASITKSFCWQFITFSNEKPTSLPCEFSRQVWTSASFWSTLGFWSSANILTTWRWEYWNVHCCIWVVLMAATRAFVVRKPSSYDSSAIQICHDCWSRRRVCRRSICARWFASRRCTSWSNFSTPSWDSVSIPARCCRHWVRFAIFFKILIKIWWIHHRCRAKFVWLTVSFSNWLNFSHKKIC